MTQNESTLTVSDPVLSVLNKKSVENLLSILQTGIYTSNNLLVLDQQLSNLINFLTPFSKLKEIGKFEKIVWLNNEQPWSDILGSFNGLIIMCRESTDNLNLVSKLINTLPKSIKVYLVVENLSKAFTYELNQELNGDLSFNSTIELNLESQKFVKLTSTVKLYNWSINPIVLDPEDGSTGGSVLSLEQPYGGLESYYTQPLEQISHLSKAFINLLQLSPHFTMGHKMLKLKNIYAKGDHSCLLAKIIQDEKIPDYLNEQMSPLESQFYLEKTKGNTDLVILERNLDSSALAFNQLNYQGLIDDLFKIDLNNVSIPKEETGRDGMLLEKLTLQDELYHDLKHLNFASIGHKLNQLAKYIQNEFSKRDSLLHNDQTENSDLTEIKKLVNNLGSLTNKQELIKKHTFISESILNSIKFGSTSTNPQLKSTYSQLNEHEEFLAFQNDLFDLEYKAQILKVREFIVKNFDSNLVLMGVLLVSIVNDGIRERDYEIILTEVTQNYGLLIKFTLDNLIRYHILRILHTGGGATSELFGAALASLSLTGHSNEDSSTTNQSTSFQGYENLNSLGISGGGVTGLKGNFTLIDKFFNLHPQEEQVNESTEDGLLIQEYSHPTFALPSSTVPLLTRIVESLYLRDFLTYKPVNNLSRRPNWDNLNLDTFFAGKSLDINICDTSDDKRQQQRGVEGPLSRQEYQYVVIIIVGGITRSEISCLKYLEQRINAKNHGEKKKKFIILTSGVVNNQKLLDFCSR
ncbi:vacuolar protein sorting-associated protein 33 [[Candida] anglica]|uniref:Vacuolar protein sorting-associated protein 33 n=1 Tax=[Candida] anglica TaxID=148631 RepID=A0ABP0EF26_9ASCO